MKLIVAGLVALGLSFVATQATAANAKPKKHYHVDPAKLRGKEFKTLAAAKSSCGSSPVVWVNTHGVVFHTQKSRWFGHTRFGTYSCMNTAKAAGFWQSKY